MRLQAALADRPTPAQGPRLRGDMKMIRTLAVVLLMLPLSSCLAGAVVGAAVDVTGAVVGTTVKTTGAVIDAAIPDGDEDEDDDRK